MINFHKNNMRPGILRCSICNSVLGHSTDSLELHVFISPCSACKDKNGVSERESKLSGVTIKPGMMFKYEGGKTPFKHLVTLFRVSQEKLMFFDYYDKTFKQWSSEVFDSSLTLKDMRGKGFNFVSSLDE